MEKRKGLIVDGLLNRSVFWNIIHDSILAARYSIHSARDVHKYVLIGENTLASSLSPIFFSDTAVLS